MNIRSASDQNLPETFEGLSNLRLLRPIHDRVDLENAQEISDRLAVLATRTPDQEDYLESLATLMEKYEADQFEINVKELSSIDLLRYLMGGRAMSESDLGRVLGGRSLGHAVLHRRRKLSKQHMKLLGDFFRVKPGLFLY